MNHDPDNIHSSGNAPEGEPSDALFPCTPLQETIFSIQQSQPLATICNVAMRWRMRGAIRGAAIEYALDTLAQRHEALRTRFVLRDGQVHQTIGPIRLRPSIIDLSRLETDLVEKEIERISKLEARKPFNMGETPLWRVTVLQLAGNEAILLLTLHFAIIDGWSIGIIGREFAALVNAHGTGGRVRLPESPLQMADYALWLEEARGSDALADGLAYWKRKLSRLVPTELPAGRPNPPATPSGDAEITSILLPDNLVTDLRSLCSRAGVTPFVVCSSAMAIVLGRRAGTHDVSIITPVANRTDALLNDMVGLTLNTLALRFDTRVTEEPLAYLAAARSAIAEAFMHGNVPFEDAIKAAGLRPSPKRPFVFGINLTVQAANVDTGRSGSIRAGDVELSSFPSVSVGALYDLNFFMVEREGEGWRLSCEFDTDRYSADDAQDLLRAWRDELARFARVREEAVRQSQLPAPSAPAIVPRRNYFRAFALQPEGTRPPIFAFNNRSAYYPIARYFGTSRPFIDIQWRDDAELPPLSADSIPELAADAARHLRDYDPVGPYYLMGHCMMGNVAFETARQLGAAGARVQTLFLLDTIAPGYIENMSRFDRIVRRISLLDHSFEHFLELIGKFRAGEMSARDALLHYRFIRQNPVSRLFRGANDNNAPDFGQDILNHGLMNYLRDAKSLYRFAVHPGDAVFFRSAEARVGRLFARDFGWSKLIGGDLRVYDTPGKHLEMTREPAAGVIAEHMSWMMDRQEGRWQIATLPDGAGAP